MINEEIKNRIDELKKVLYAMSEKISALSADGNEQIASVQQKAVEVLNGILVRIDNSDLLYMDQETAQEELNKVSHKAAELYESALLRINSLKGEEPKQDIQPEAAPVEQDELSAQAASVILSWLKKEVAQ